MYAVIMAGGRGERLWPASTREWPKPFLPLASGKALLRATYDRVVPLVGQEGVYVVAGRELAERVSLFLGIPPGRLIVEPRGKNTAPAVGLAAAFLAEKDPEAVLIMLPADHLIRGEEGFRRCLSAALAAARDGHLVTLGIRPTRPATGYGYIEPGEPLEGGEIPLYQVRRFVEKPPRELAEEFLSRGYLWNSGIFVWRAARILEEIDRYLPRLSGVLRRVGPAGEELVRAWDEVEEISIDSGVMERAADVAVVPAEFEWRDLGDWQAVWESLAGDGGVASVGTEPFAKDARNTLIWSRPGRVVAALGVEGLAIVDAPEALLVTKLDRSQEVRELARAAESPPDWDELYGRDASGMLAAVKALPGQARDALSLGESAELPWEELAGFSRVVVAGMGGSGISGDLLASLLPCEVIASRGYNIPGFVGEETLLVAVSYSGNTEETLASFEQGLSRTRRAIAVSSGGKLRALAEEHGVPWIGIPAGLQPRAALGYLLFSLLGVFRRLGTFSEDPREALAVLEGMAEELSPGRKGNPAQALALALWRRVPLIYGAGCTAPVAMRWKTQVNENAKQPAFWGELPEVCHNEIVGYELTGGVMPQAEVVFLRSACDHPRVAARIDILKEVLTRRGLPFQEVRGRGESKAAQLLSLLYLGDWVSVYLALLNRVDPTPVRPIQELKDRLARI